MENRANKLAEDWALQKSFEARMAFLVKLGRTLAPLAAEDKTGENEVRGCESRTWLKVELKQGRLALAGDSEARIVKGLMALLLSPYQGQSPQQARGFDARSWFAELGLSQYLSPSRASGLAAMLDRLEERLDELS
ncbi:SufE family protein [Gallaecimonas sp. GXIMD4217]|uniref:SufE family protein n=1 Tax=Gallaecimonas sp. GXIMD4217 TaxID=3131927 RepID=UPI00311B2597